MTGTTEAKVSSNQLRALIADTFNVPPQSITDATRPEDVVGWDSLGHSVLLTRIARKLHLQISEEVAATFENVGELAERLRQLPSRLTDG